MTGECKGGCDAGWIGFACEKGISLFLFRVR